jgi:uncharacterized damage-inducible protein DinB
MTNQTQALLELWIESRTRFSNQLLNINQDDLKKKLAPGPNSVGFLIRHIGDVEFLFAKNVFGAAHLKVSAKTVIDKYDSGDWTNLEDLTIYTASSFDALKSIVVQQNDADWQTIIETKEFGTKTKAQAFGRIVSHTAYHAGQMAMIVKYGS